MSDDELLARLRQGDHGAFDAIFRAWYPRLVRLAEATVRERAVAEEIAQDVMLELWKRRAVVELNGAPQAYLLQATRNRALNHVRHRQVQQRSAVHLALDEAREAPAPSRLVAAEMREAAEAALAALTPRCREVFELSRVHGLRYQEIADALGVSVKAVEAQIGKALQTFRQHLAPWLPAGKHL